MNQKLNKQNLLKALAKMANAKPKLIVIGDLILDEYLIGYPERISREAPVLILEYKENYYKSGKMKEEEIEEIFSSNFNRDVELKNVVLNSLSIIKKWVKVQK